MAAMMKMVKFNAATLEPAAKQWEGRHASEI